LLVLITIHHRSLSNKLVSFKKSGIVTAMVGLLNAPTGTRLFQRLNSEDRLLNIWNGNNVDGVINFIPKMNYQKLMSGYKEILQTIYSPGEYYLRVKSFLQDYKLPIKKTQSITFTGLKAFFKSLWILGIWEKGRWYYWKLLFYSLAKYPQKFSIAVTLAIYGFHFRKVSEAI